METQDLKKVVETLLFITDQPLPLARLGQILGEGDLEKVRSSIEGLRAEWETRGGGVQILEIAQGFQMATRPGYAPFIRKLFADKMAMRLSRAALETLAIIAYKQPITRAEVEEIRGVEVIAALETLLEKRLIRVVGRKETIGRPLLYGTQPEFLRHFGLKSLEDLPPLESLAVDPAGPQPAPPSVGACDPAASAGTSGSVGSAGTPDSGAFGT